MCDVHNFAPLPIPTLRYLTARCNRKIDAIRVFLIEQRKLSKANRCDYPEINKLFLTPKFKTVNFNALEGDELSR